MACVQITVEQFNDPLRFNSRKFISSNSQKLFFKSCLHLGLLKGAGLTVPIQTSFTAHVRIALDDPQLAITAATISKVCDDLQNQIPGSLEQSAVSRIVQRAYEQAKKHSEAAAAAIKEKWPSCMTEESTRTATANAFFNEEDDFGMTEDEQQQFDSFTFDAANPNYVDGSDGYGGGDNDEEGKVDSGGFGSSGGGGGGNGGNGGNGGMIQTDHEPRSRSSSLGFGQMMETDFDFSGAGAGASAGDFASSMLHVVDFSGIGGGGC